MDNKSDTKKTIDDEKIAENQKEERKSDNTQSIDQTKKIADLSQKLKEAENKILLAHAESENIRKRMQRQLEEAHKFSIASFAKDIVGTLDDLYRAIEDIDGKEATQENLRSVIEGVELTKSNFESSLGRHGIKRLYPKNKKFDYKEHEALSQVPSDSCKEETVMEVVQPGYTLKDKMLRHAQVIVAVPK